MKEYQQNNKNKLSHYNSLRWMNKSHSFTNEQWLMCKDYFSNSCAYCGMSEDDHKKLFDQQLHKEHVEHNGSNDIDNCVPSCKTCNSQKWTFALIEWYNEKNENFSQDRLNRINNWLRYDYKKTG